MGGRGSEAARFKFPEGVVIDHSGNVYVADTYNHRVQKLSPDGEVLPMGKAWFK